MNGKLIVSVVDSELVVRASRLVSEGPLPLWAGACVALVGVAWALWQARREFAGTRRTFLHKFVLPAIRVSVVLSAAWLLCRPRLVTTETTTSLPTVLAVVDTSRSMSVSEGGLRFAQRLELLAAGDKTLVLPRDRAAGAIASAASRLLRETDRRRAALDRDAASLDAKYPLTSDGQRRVRELGATLAAGLKEVRSLPAPDTANSNDARVRKAAADYATRTQTFIAAADAFAADAELVAKEASDHPQMLGDHLKRYAGLRSTCQAWIESSWSLQDALDRVALGEPASARVAGAPVVRGAIAAAQANRLAESLGKRATLVRAESRGIVDALRDAGSRRAAGKPRAVVVLTDGAGRTTERASSAHATRLSAAGTRVHTILCAAEGVEPADLALVAIDTPPVVVRDAPVAVRLLVKNQLPSGKAARVEVRSGDVVLATKPLDPNERGTSIVELTITPRSSGRSQWVFETLSDGADAMPGNERRLAVVDTVDDPVRVILLADRLCDETASYIEALRAIPAVRLTTFVAAAGGERVKLGGDEGMFPAKVDEWKGVSAAVLIGDVPETWRAGDKSAVPSGLRQAIEEHGLRVLLHPLGDGKTWTTQLGLSSTTEFNPSGLSPEEGVWWSGLMSSMDARESRESWQRMGDAQHACFSLDVGERGAPLLRGGDRVVVGVRSCGRGLVVFNGLGAMSALRGGERTALCNALIGGLLDPLLRAHRDDAGLDTFPAQPVRGGTLFVTSSSAPWRRMNIDKRERIELERDGGTLRRDVDDVPGDADLRFAARGDEARAIAELTGGTFTSFDDPTATLDALGAALEPVTTREVRVKRLWPGWWPLPLLLALVSAEYLLRRRAGRVM